MKKILITLLLIGILFISSCGENKIDTKVIFSEENKVETFVSETENALIEKESNKMNEKYGNTEKINEEKKELTIYEQKAKVKKDVLFRMNEGKSDSEDIGLLAWTIETEKELFKIIEKLESREEYIYYYKFWNELQFAKFTSNYCSEDGYKELLKKIETQPIKVQKSELWKEILKNCGLDEKKMFTNDNYIQLEIIHNQYQAQRNFDELANYDCKKILSSELEKKCIIMKVSLVKYNKKTCDDLIYKEDKDSCNEIIVK